MRLLALLSVCASLLPTATALNILIFLIGTNQFERATLEYLAQQLALRNHNVVTVKPILIPEEPRLVKPKLHLVREKTLKNLLPKSQYEPLEKVGNTIPWKEKKYELEEHLYPYWVAHNASCYKMINSNLMDTLKKDNLDVAIVYSGNPCQLAIAHVLGVPVIYYDQEGFSDETLVAAGVPLNLDIPLSNCPQPMANPLAQRFINGLCLLGEFISQSGFSTLAGAVSHRYRLLDGPITKQFATDYTLKKRFKSFPDVNSLKQQAELFFVNTDPLLEYPHALPPHVIPVAGLHIDQPKPLFAPWNTTIEAAPEGLIVVSLGTQANSSAMTQNQAKVILGALSRFTKYRIYWRVGPSIALPGVDPKAVPDHINLTAYLPQNDLLAHKKAKLLITNGGMSSIMEALSHGVPIVGIPLYGSNRHNLGKVQNKGLGLVLQKDQLTESNLVRTIKTVLESSKYKTVADDMSREYRARTSSPFETALHWIEHVGRHKSAAFIRPPIIENRFLRILNLDFLFVVLLSLLIPLYASHRILKSLISPSSSPKKDSSSSYSHIKSHDSEADSDVDLKKKKKH